MSSSGLKNTNFQNMTEDNKQQKISDSTDTANAYSTCYRLPFLSLFHADCMEIMKQYPDKYFDLAIVDPPYGINIGTEIDRSGFRAGSSKNSLTKFEKSMKCKNWDNETPNYEYFLELFRISKNQIIWGGNYFLEHLPNTRCMIIWDKMTYVPTMSQVELAWTSFKKHSLLKKINSNQLDRTHPTQKPVALYDWILHNFANENQKILDTHFGSGSIALAVDKANRLDKMNLHLTACEIDKEYIDKAIKRISESIKQGTLSF